MKTIEEMACEYCNKTFQCSKEKTEELAKSCLSGKKMCFLDGIKYAQTWISVDDELPEEIGGVFPTSKFVLALTSANEPCIALYNHNSKVWSILERGFDKITHWRPIELE